jgi:hypothetical protein
VGNQLISGHMEKEDKSKVSNQYLLKAEHDFMILLQWLDWFVQIDNPVPFWKAQPTYILAAVVFLIGAVGNLIHGEFVLNIVDSC